MDRKGVIYSLLLLVGLLLMVWLEGGEGLVFKNNKGRGKDKTKELDKSDKKTIKLAKQALTEADPARALKVLETFMQSEAVDPSTFSPELLWLNGRALKNLKRYTYVIL